MGYEFFLVDIVRRQFLHFGGKLNELLNKMMTYKAFTPIPVDPIFMPANWLFINIPYIPQATLRDTGL